MWALATDAATNTASAGTRAMTSQPRAEGLLSFPGSISIKSESHAGDPRVAVAARSWERSGGLGPVLGLLPIRLEGRGAAIELVELEGPRVGRLARILEE